MPTHHPRRPLAGSLVLALLAALCSVIAVAAPAHAADITVSKSAPENVLAGDDVDFSLAVTNPSGPSAAPEYNVTFRDVLPLGVTYAAGSTSPDTYGEPDVRTDADGRQVLIWSNIMLIWPPTRSISAGALPLYGTCRSLTPVWFASSSVAMCPVPPAPEVP